MLADWWNFSAANQCEGGFEGGMDLKAVSKGNQAAIVDVTISVLLLKRGFETAAKDLLNDAARTWNDIFICFFCVFC